MVGQFQENARYILLYCTYAGARFGARAVRMISPEPVLDDLYQVRDANLIVSVDVLPICATTVLLLIQDNLSLVFELMALVAAVRFRVRQSDTLDGIYVFAAICVGLASGIGNLGVAVVMTIFFCFASVIL